jgi:hypothetical protein
LSAIKSKCYVNGILIRSSEYEFDEQLALVKDFFINSGGDTQYLVKLLNQVDITLTDGTRRFIADVLSGKVKPAGKLKKNYLRDLKIYWSVNELRVQDDKLTINKDSDGAVQKVALKFNVSYEAALKAYQRMEKKFSNCDLNDFL